MKKILNYKFYLLINIFIIFISPINANAAINIISWNEDIYLTNNGKNSKITFIEKFITYPKMHIMVIFLLFLIKNSK